MLRKIAILALTCLALSVPASAQLTTVDSGSGINEVVTVTSANLFKLVLEAQDNWGFTQWYDLVNDAGATTNLILAYGVVGTGAPCERQNSLANITFYGDNDRGLHSYEAGCYWSNTARSMSILASNSLEVVIQTAGVPLISAQSGGPDTNITVTTTYSIFWNGKIYVHQNLAVVTAVDLTVGGTINNFIIEVPLNDPSGGSSNGTTSGWVRATNASNPWAYDGMSDMYAFAYWNASDPNYPNFTKASIMMVPSSTSRTNMTNGMIQHGWSCGTGCGTQRWGYMSNPSSSGPFNLGANSNISWDWLIQLGTQNSSVLPNLTSSTVTGPIATAYINSPTPPPFIAPSNPVVSTGGATQAFSCTQSCGTPGANPWSCANASNGGACLGSINTSTGVYTPPATFAAPNSAGGFQLLPADHIFNTNIASLPTRSDSGTLIAGAGSVAVNYLASFGFNYTTPSTPTDNLNFFYTSANNGAFQSPAWPNAIEGGWFDAVALASNADHHFITLDTTNGNITERYGFYAQAPLTSCTVNGSNSATCTITPTTTSPGFVRSANLGQQVQVGGWTGADTFLNGIFTLTSASPTTITFNITHGTATTTTSGQATLQLGSNPCGPAGTCNSQSGVKYSYKDYPLPANASTDAAGMYLSPLTLHSNEVVNACANGTAITHALRATLQNGFLHPAFLWPATTFANAGAGANYYGERVRLKSSFAIGSFSACAQKLLTQMKNYGLIFADGGAGWQIQLDIDNTTPAAVSALKEINAANIATSNWEVVDESSLMEEPWSGSANNGEIITYTSSTGTATTHVDLQGTALNAGTNQYYIMQGTPQQQLTFYSNGAFTCAMSPTVGSITAGCLYTPPASVASVTKTTVTATSSVTGTVTAQTIVYVLPSPFRLIQADSDFTDSHSNVWFSNNNFGVGMSNIPSWEGSSQVDGSLTGTDKQLYWGHLSSSLTQGDYKMDFHVPAGTYQVTFNNGTQYAVNTDVRYFYLQGVLVGTIDSTAVAGGLHLPWSFTANATVGSNNTLSFYNAGIGGQTFGSDISSISVAPIAAAITAAPPRSRAILLP